jgi:hypothetical protein
MIVALHPAHFEPHVKASAAAATWPADDQPGALYTDTPNGPPRLASRQAVAYGLDS